MPIRKISQQLAILFIIAFMLSGYGCSNAKPFVVSGETLDAVGKQFISVANLYNTLLDTKQVSPETYKKWAAFAVHFKVAYPVAVSTWKNARAANDQGLEKKNAELIQTLVKQLSEFGELAFKIQQGSAN